MNDLFLRLYEQIRRRDTADLNSFLQGICDLLKNEVPHYHWVCFYLNAPDQERVLELGPFAGPPTEHLRIPYGKGICGQAAETGQPFIIQDVSKESNYLSCSAKVLSEIVIPIKRVGRILGEVDIDSHDLNPFSHDDIEFLGEIAALVEPLL